MVAQSAANTANDRAGPLPRPRDDAAAQRASEAERHAASFEALLGNTPVEAPKTGSLAGPPHLDWRGAQEALGAPPSTGADNLHFAMNVATLLRLGFAGIEETARANAQRLDGEEAAYLEAIARCHAAARRFAAAHADEAERLSEAARGEEKTRLSQIAENCRALSERAPRTFSEAVQLFWFAWCMRGHGTIGRLDQHLYPFYKADLEAGRLTRGDALGLLCELWEGCNRAGSGDTLVNLVVGGQDRDGNDATNDLSYLMIDASLTVRKTEPHLSARIHARTPESFLRKIVELQLMGHGQGAIYNDEQIVPSLVEKGVPVESARNYANDGCTEVTIDGESGIEFIQMEAVKALELTLFNGEENVPPGEPVGRYITRHQERRRLRTGLELGYRTGDFSSMRTFGEVCQAFLDQYLRQVDRLLDALCERIRDQQRRGVSSPFLAGMFPGCLASGVDPFRGGFTIPCYMLFSGSIPTAADGLAAIKQVVFEEKSCTPGELLRALRDNFEGHEALRRRLLAAPKFGNDDDCVDEIATDIARRFCDRVVRHPTPTGKPFWPALYDFLFNDFAKIVGATPDGRRWRDPIGEHYSPTPGRARKGPTAIIRSAAKGPLYEACGSSIFHISLARSMAPANESGAAVVRQLLDAALQMGVAVMDVAIYDVEALKDAKRHPELHEDLIVRVWGFSARFVDLCDDMQDHIIARAVTGG
jgi:formate C-acetyltransferase